MKTEIPPGPTARPRSRKRAPLARPQFEALESRLLIAADLPIVALPPPSVELSQATTGVHMLAPREIVVLDTSLQNLAALRDAIALDTPQAEVLVLDASRDAFDQIGDKLAAGEPVSAIHLVAHGQAGQFVLHGAVIDASELARRTAQLQSWNFADSADILLYGCNVAEGPNGQAFIDMLASLTGADVAASSDLTGAIDLGADWDLEVITGSIETATIAGPTLAKLWRGTLDATASVAATGWGVSGSTSVTEGQSASYLISLSDSITFGGSASVALSLADTTTSASDHGDFAAAVTAAIASRPDLAFDGTRLTYSPTAFGGYGRTYDANGALGAVSIAGTGTSLQLRDDEFLRVDLDFAFDYFGVSQSSVFVDANGYVTFGSSAGSVYTNGSLAAGTALGGLGAIAAFWDDLDPNAGGDVYVETLGSPGSRQFVIEWSDTPYYGSGSADGATIQLVLHEGSGIVEMRYLDIDFAGVDTSHDGGASATIGLQNGSGTRDEFSFDTASVIAGSSLVYRPQGVAMSPLTISLTTTDDSIAESTEDFAVHLSAALGSGITAADIVTTLLTDNDAFTPVNVVPVAVTAVEDTVFAFTGGNTISITDGDVKCNVGVGHGHLGHGERHRGFGRLRFCGIAGELGLHPVGVARSAKCLAGDAGLFARCQLRGRRHAGDLERRRLRALGRRYRDTDRLARR